LSIEPKMEDLLASIRKAIDSDEDGAGPGSGTAGEARGTLMRGALRELRVNLNESKARNESAREEIAELRGRILRNATEVPPIPPPPRRAARPLVEPQRATVPSRNDFKAIMAGPGQVGGHASRQVARRTDAQPLPPDRRLINPQVLPHAEPPPPMRARTLQDEFDDITYGSQQETDPGDYAAGYEQPHAGHAAYEEPGEQVYEDPRGYYPPPAPPRMLSNHAEEATQAAFRHLSDALFSQGMGGRSLEDVTRELLRGMLKQWLDDNLPPLVERLVREEIARVARNGR
jgi:cell pole-organizing protein PopZ